MKYIFILFFFPLLVYGQTITERIHLDQFGYLPTALKVAVLSDPQMGYNSAASYTPGALLEVRKNTDNSVVFSGAPAVWNSGTTHDQSGDKIWWFDFSAVTAPGEYHIYDATNNVRSYTFSVSDCIYKEPMNAVLKSFYYQRCGTPKSAPYVATGYTDGACHTGTFQDTDCRLYNNTGVSTAKDLSGGWHDAGDYNKYVNFAWATLIDMLLAYEENPSAWTDDTGIPESGNGTPDLLDEIKYELDWLLKMQNADGSVLSVVGGGAATPPSSDNTQRLYGPATTSATYSTAAMFALAAIQFTQAGNTTYAQTLETAAINAFTWAESHPGITFYNAGVLAAGEQQTDSYGTLTRRLSAAAFLYARTQQNTFKTIVENNYTQVHLITWSYAYLFEVTEQDFLLYFAKQPGVTLSVKNAIMGAYANSMSAGNGDNLMAWLNGMDAYRAYVSDQNYTWGSSTFKCRQGSMFTTMNELSLDTANHTEYEEAAAGILHYMHGVNPVGKAYITNMNSKGAENSVTEVYHAWFHDGSTLWDAVGTSTYGPAPGFIPGGANPTYDWDDCCVTMNCGSSQNNALCTSISISPPKNQPHQKSYKDFNNGWPINSWEVTEPGIYTHAAYLRLVSKFIVQPCSVLNMEEEQVESAVLNIYPNPANDLVYGSLSSDDAGGYLEIKSMDGRTIIQQKIIPSGNIFSLDISSLGNGIYILQYSTNRYTYAQKLVVK